MGSFLDLSYTAKKSTISIYVLNFPIGSRSRCFTMIKMLWIPTFDFLEFTKFVSYLGSQQGRTQRCKPDRSRR